MGFSSILDILGAIITGGMLMLILFRLNDAGVQNTYNNTQDLIVQQNLTSVIDVMESDLRKLGYCKDWNKIPDPTKSILVADSTRIKFLTDLDNNGTVDTLDYYVGTTTELKDTPNPNDRMLYRVVNHDKPRSANLGITYFNLLYFGALGDTLSFPIVNTGSIQSIQISIRVEDTEAYQNEYRDAFWRQVRLSSRNLRNR